MKYLKRLILVISMVQIILEWWHGKLFNALKPFYRYLKRLLITFIFQRGNLKDCLHLKSLAQTIDRINASKIYKKYTKTQVKFDGCCLKQEKMTFTHKEVSDIYIVYDYLSYYLSYDYLFIILSSILVQDMVVGLMQAGVFHYLMIVGLVKM